MQYAVTNPLTGVVEKTWPVATAEQIRSALTAAHEARRTWKQTPLARRCEILTAAADLISSRREELAETIAVEMGKPITHGLGEVDLTAEIHRHTADVAPQVLADRPLDVGAMGGSALVRHEPLGAVLGVMPWNYPYYQIARFAAPNLALGNVVLLKPAPQCPASAEKLAKIYREAGVPQAVYTTLLASNEQIAELIADPRVQGVSLTGSERAGSQVAETAGRHLTKSVLELGGSDPFIVLPGADLDKAVADAVLGRFENSGQACNAAKRFILVGETYQPFLDRFAQAVAELPVGDPRDEQTEVGPLVSEAAAQGVQAQIDDALALGATAVVGGRRPDREGSFVAPTVLTGVTPQMRAWSEEIFGPVATVHQVPDVDAAVRLANDTRFGLGVTIHAATSQEALELADRIESGMVFINEAPGSAAELPFGGVKASGYGRELGDLGFFEFANQRMIRIGS